MFNWCFSLLLSFLYINDQLLYYVASSFAMIAICVPLYMAKNKTVRPEEAQQRRLEGSPFRLLPPVLLLAHSLAQSAPSIHAVAR